MIGKYVWFERIVEDGQNWVNCRCDVCGHINKFSETRYTMSGYLACFRCEDFTALEECLQIIDYASNEVFLN